MSAVGVAIKYIVNMRRSYVLIRGLGFRLSSDHKKVATQEYKYEVVINAIIRWGLTQIIDSVVGYKLYELLF